MSTFQPLSVLSPQFETILLQPKLITDLCPEAHLLVTLHYACHSTLVGNPTPVRGILEKILPEILQNLPKAVGRGQILEGRGQDFFKQFRGMRGWISA